jgi:hypothetical protein
MEKQRLIRLHRAGAFSSHHGIHPEENNGALQGKLPNHGNPSILMILTQ